MKVDRSIFARWVACLSLGLLSACSSGQRRVVYVPATMGVSGVDPSEPPRTISLNFLIFQFDNLIVLDRHPNVRLRLWACGQHFATEAAQWEAEVGWPEDRFVLGTGCSSDSQVVVGLENTNNGHYLGLKKLSLGDMLEANPLELDGVGGKIFLDVQSYHLPGIEEPRRVPLSVPAARSLDELVLAQKLPQRPAPVDGWMAVPVAKGDTVHIHVNGSICGDGGSCFGPEGSSTFFGLFTNHRLMAKVGAQLAHLNRDQSFVSEHTGDLLIYVEGAGPSLHGAYDAIVDVNPKQDDLPSRSEPTEVIRSLRFNRASL